ncbi:MAG TPA: sigma-54 dependent transcriptional regulator [Thermodesulfovibrionales bacterium]|nr:sigma-54 dependent transcriptional regulator [Thermodesulfovibrionales bacterium]
MNSAGRILIVDDEPNAIKVLSAILVNDGYDVFDATDGKTAVRTVSNKDIDLVITDIKMPGMNGMQLFEYLHNAHPDIPIIFLTAYGTVEDAVDALTMGSFYYFIKPPDYSKLRTVVSKAVEQRRMKKELASLREMVTDKDAGHEIVGNSPAILKLKDTIKTIRDSESSVLITGETGTGKELIARALHYSSSMKNNPFVAMSCAAIPRELLEAELFGFEKGAFTGALSFKPGKFEAAAGGTLFLDEIAELEINLQVKLLRVLQEREIERLGSNKKIDLKFRLISSTNRDLKKEIKAGRFREDLFYRINVVHIVVPPLRDRREDIPLLTLKFIKEMCARENKMLTASDEVLEVFQAYHWPGNIRQLRNVVERAVLLAKGEKITVKDLPIEYNRVRRLKEINNSQLTLKEIERDAIKSVLLQCEGNKSEACRILGISRKAFYKRLKEHELM